MGISSAGIGSGLDVASIVNQLVAAERSPTAARIDRTERQVNGQISALGALRSAFDGLRSAVTKVSSDDSALARKSSLPPEPNFSASAAPGAAIGKYSVEVIALATAHKVSTGAYADSETAVGTGTLTITSGETTFDIEIDAENNSLADIRDAINKATDGKGVTASRIHADDGAHLVVTATEPGIAIPLSISASGGDGGLAAMTDAAAMSEISAATDALVEVNGFQRSSASNSIDDMLEGVTLTLTKAAPGTVQDFSVSSDVSPLRAAAKGLVTAYNAALDAIAKTTKYDPSSGVAIQWRDQRPEDAGHHQRQGWQADPRRGGVQRGDCRKPGTGHATVQRRGRTCRWAGNLAGTPARRRRSARRPQRRAGNPHRQHRGPARGAGPSHGPGGGALPHPVHRPGRAGRRDAVDQQLPRPATRQPAQVLSPPCTAPANTPTRTARPA